MYKALDAARVNFSSYHPQTNSAMEGFHWTLKSMFRKLKGGSMEWDVLLPILFAYKEAPVVATEFSLFDIILANITRAP